MVPIVGTRQQLFLEILPISPDFHTQPRWKRGDKPSAMLSLHPTVVVALVRPSCHRDVPRIVPRPRGMLVLSWRECVACVRTVRARKETASSLWNGSSKHWPIRPRRKIPGRRRGGRGEDFRVGIWILKERKHRLAGCSELFFRSSENGSENVRRVLRMKWLEILEGGRASYILVYWIMI